MHHSWMSDCGVTNVTTLDTPVGQAPPSSSIPIPLPCPSNGMLPSNPTMSSLPTPCTIESPALSPSQRCGDLLRRGSGTFEQASNTFYVTVECHMAAITANQKLFEGQHDKQIWHAPLTAFLSPPEAGDYVLHI
ncbi:hypothetical protein EMCRGX_G002688 [Ephydatia muelleri]